MKYILWICVFAFAKAYTQGPPITVDKALMLGSGSYTIRSLTEIRNTERLTAVFIPVEGVYLPTANTSIGVVLPYITYNFEEGPSGSNIADIEISGKYQFVRKDGTGKTFRVLAKTTQNLPTGQDLDIIGLSTALYEGYYGFVSAYETLKYGISSELGYNWVPGGTLDELRAKLGFGLPLLKPQYPNRQLNLYFEYSSSWLTTRDWYQLFYAQGIQYAGKNITIDASIQLPLAQDLPEFRELNYSLFIGGRYSF